MTRSNHEHEPGKDSAGDQQENPDHESPPVSASTVVDESNTPVGEDRTADASNDKRPYWQRSVNWDRWFAGVLVVCAVIQASVGWFQWDSMREQTGIMQGQLEQAQTALAQTDETVGQMRLEQRAWLGNGKPKKLVLETGDLIRCEIAVKNTGRTPGTLTSVVGVVFFRGSNIGIDDVIDSVAESQSLNVREGVIAPEGVHRFNTASSDVLTDQQLKAAKDGHLTLYYVGAIYYDDIMDNRRKTSWCFWYDFERDDFYSHEQYNYMD